MGQASRKKRERRELRRQRPELERKLREQYDLLVVLGRVFDEGHVVVALPLSTSIKLLVYDYGKRLGLLGLLGVLDTLTFRDTASRIDPNNLLPSHPGLVSLRVGAGGDTGWAALGAAALTRPPANPDIPFKTWWTAPVTKDTSGKTWARRDFVLHLRDKEGGAHVDPYEPDEGLRALEETHSLGWSRVDPITGETTTLNGPILPSVRQIAFELQLTIEPLIAGFAVPAV